MPDVGSHVGFVPVQSDVFDAEQIVQRPLKPPDALHAGAAALGHAAPVPPLSAVHCAHVPVASHVGVCAGQF